MPPTPEELSKTLNFTSITNGWSPFLLLKPPPVKNLQTIIHTLPWEKESHSLVMTINGPSTSKKYLLNALHQARRNKTETEIATMRKINTISSEAHELLMKAVGSGKVIDENEAESIFVAYCRKFG